MKLPSFRRIIKNDYEDKYQSLVETLSVSINYGIDSLYDALNKKISLKYNILGTVKDVTVQVDSTGKPIQTTGFKLDFTNKVAGVFVGKAENLTNPNDFPASVFIHWTQNGDSVQINNIAGLSTSNSYKLRIIAFGDEN